jgi:ribosome-associated protein
VTGTPGRGAYLRIDEHTAIDAREIVMRATRSSGPGGQNVNKTATRITLRFDVQGSHSLNAGQKFRLRDRLGGRLTSRGHLVLHEEGERTQAANRRRAIDRLVRLLRQALAVPRKRIPTRAGPAARERRLAQKKRKAIIKRRRRVDPDPAD